MIAIEVAKHATSFDCSTCQHKNCDSDGSRPGSKGPGFAGQWEINGVIKSNTCLLPMISGFSRECLKLYSFYKQGILISTGGFYDQPNLYTQAMGLIDGHAA